MRRLLTGLLLVALSLSAGCPREAAPQDDGVLRVVATTGMIGDIAQRIAGADAQVTALMGPGVDPHLYKARESDVDVLFTADVVLYNGLHLEARLGDVLEKLAGHKIVVAVGAAVPADRRLMPVGSEGLPDPHIWFDVGLWRLAAGEMAAALVQADPAHAEEYRRRLAEVQAELDELDAYVRAQVERVPPEQRVLITAHDAFNYFGAAYGFEVVGLQGVSTAAEAGTGDVRALVDLIVARQIPAVFIESSVPERNIKAVQEAAAARGVDVAIGGELYSDAMGDAGSPAGTYVGMVRHNIDTIVAALGGAGQSEVGNGE
ncbi:zinc ABC transporter substrate-binding protein [bacterium]|nr:zinc ABC transporter substrate-binding protein [bacterium]